MQVVVPTVLCIVLMALAGILITHSFITSADDISLALETSSDYDTDINRTEIATVNATALGTKVLRVSVVNDGQVKLAGFSEWDIIAEYEDDEGTHYSTWLPYSSDTLEANEWYDSGITYNDEPEVFEPGILNTGEAIYLDIFLDPLPAEDSTVTIHVTTPNGVDDDLSYPVASGDFTLTPHSESVSINGTSYYLLRESWTADGTTVNATTLSIGKWETGTWLLYDEPTSSVYARHVYSLADISEIPSCTWTVSYRGYATSGFQDDPYFSIAVLIRKADGSVREIIDTSAAPGTVTQYNDWHTIAAIYEFPGYVVVEETDYLEVDYYANVPGKGSNKNSNYLKLRIDDDTLDREDQTRIE